MPRLPSRAAVTTWLRFSRMKVTRYRFCSLSSMIRMRAMRRSFLGQRQREGERASYAPFAFGADLPAQQADKVLADGQAQPGAFMKPVEPALQLLKRLKESPQVFRADADAGVGHADFQPSIQHPALQPHFAPFGEFDGVAEEIEQDLLDPPPVADHNADAGGDGGSEGQPLLLRLG